MPVDSIMFRWACKKKKMSRCLETGASTLAPTNRPRWVQNEPEIQIVYEEFRVHHCSTAANFVGKIKKLKYCMKILRHNHTCSKCVSLSVALKIFF